MSDRLLFWTPTLIWATTWYAILFQLGSVPVQQSIAMRFGLAGLLLVGLALWQRARLRWDARTHAWMALTGCIQYGMNYLGTYHAEQFVPSGLVAVVFALMIFTNALAGALVFGERVTRRFVGFAVLGVLGIALVFWPDLAAAAQDAQDAKVAQGLAWALMAISFATLGNVLTLRLTRQGVPLLSVLAWGMLYGAAGLVLLMAAMGLAPVWEVRPSYWLALLYLSAFGSVAAFVLYFRLAQRKGAAHAALTGMVIPVIALAISAVFEGWRPTPLSMLGVGLSLLGLWGATRAR